MSEAAHTPGPWLIDSSGNIGNAIKAQSGKRAYEGDNGFRTVALFMDCCASEFSFEQDANRLANARLIVAAPELLAALEKAEELYQLGIINAPDGLFDEVQRLRRAAIAAAKGGAA